MARHYSGPSGQIVSEKILNLGAKFLHLHSGWLPDYRGSTTLYYTILNKGMPAVTALFLDKSIDTGPVIKRRYYPVPDKNIDIDSVYDPAIRADFLVKLFQQQLLDTEVALQNALEGNTYYVIHPVLKHIAILSLK